MYAWSYDVMYIYIYHTKKTVQVGWTGNCSFLSHYTCTSVSPNRPTCSSMSRTEPMLQDESDGLIFLLWLAISLGN